MMRSIGSLSLLALAVGAVAQANFTIVRPVDNARVREKVKILFPKGSVPAGGYVGIFLNGQLIDSMVPPPNGKYLEYILDTKGRGLPDTPAGKPDRLEAKLFVDYNDQPRVLKNSSVDLNIANIASIRVPNGGFKLRYRYQPGTELVYRMTQRVAVDTISESQNKLGGRPAELPIDTETIRMKYAVDNAYPNGDGLVRMQAMPIKGKNYAILTLKNDPTPKKYLENEMASIYMRLTPTGKEVFGSIPVYWPLEGTSAGSRLDLFAAFPLPSLPEKSVRPGDSWQSRFQNGSIDLNKLHSQTNVVKGIPARGEFVGVEWEAGHPCAKIHNTIAAGQISPTEKALIRQGAPIAGEKVQVDETVWFAMDTRQVIKTVRDTTIETKQEGLGGGTFGGGAPGGFPGGGPGGPGGYPGGGRGGPGGRGGERDDLVPSVPDTLRQRPGMGGMPGGYQGGPPGGYQGGPGGFPGRGGVGGPGGNAPADATYVRIRLQQIFVLEP